MHLVYVVLWVLPSVLVGVGVGVYMGLSRSRQQESMQKEREKTLKALQSVLESTEQLTKNVDSHNAELHTVERSVVDLQGSGEIEDVQNALLLQIANLLESNQQLEDNLVCTHYQLEEQAIELDRAQKEARTDTLSGVSNRKSFDERLHYQLVMHSRQQLPFCLILADVDRFKWINDTHGHLVGDQVVTLIGAKLKENLRDTDFVARYGGDEFAFLLPNIEREMAESIGQRIRELVERTNFAASVGEKVSVTFSLGLAMVRDGDTPESIIRRADDALYKSKHGGRNQLHADTDPASEQATGDADVMKDDSGLEAVS